MQNQIIQTGTDTYTLAIRGATMTLTKHGDMWEMRTESAATRAWNRGGWSTKSFRSLEHVEQHYKSWRGIAALANL